MNLLVVAIMVLISSFLGLPWMCLAAVETSVHLDSLKVWSSFDAPGVKSHVVKVREQRLTLFFTGILVGEFLPASLFDDISHSKSGPVIRFNAKFFHSCLPFVNIQVNKTQFEPSTLTNVHICYVYAAMTALFSRQPSLKI